MVLKVKAFEYKKEPQLKLQLFSWWAFRDSTRALKSVPPAPFLRYNRRAFLVSFSQPQTKKPQQKL